MVELECMSRFGDSIYHTEEPWCSTDVCLGLQIVSCIKGTPRNTHSTACVLGVSTKQQTVYECRAHIPVPV